MYSENDFRLYRSGELYHHGVKGQKWGIRRYQNADGSLTDEGRARYEKLRKNVERSAKVGAVVGGIAGGATALGANVALSLSTGFFAPYLQFTLSGYAAVAAATAGGNFMEKQANKKLSSFEKALEQDRKEQDRSENESAHETVRRLNSVQDKLLQNTIKNTPEATKEERASQIRTNDKNKKFVEDYYSKKVAQSKREDNLERQLAAENKKAMMTRAKEKGIYDTGFLEAVQNTGKMGDKKWMQSQYSKYLDDPDDYWDNRDKLPQE